MKNILIIGAGITGLTLARKLAEKNNKITIVEKRGQIGGNCYDFFKDGNYIQKYGPHIFHTNSKIVWDFLNKFTSFNNYKHKVLGFVNGRLINIPFNLNTIKLIFPDRYIYFKNLLIKKFGINNKISIIDLKNEKQKGISELSNYIYKNIFLNYTIKQWDVDPENIDKSVISRVPVFISKDNKYFQDKYQGIPDNGFTKMFKEMIKHPNIILKLNLNYKNIDLNVFDKIYYTGPLDFFFNYKYGKIKYRKIYLKFKKYNKVSYQKVAVINYPNNEKFTRITEFNKFLNIKNTSTIIIEEYPSWNKGFVGYPVLDNDNQIIINKYLQEVDLLKNVKFVGRLAECKYYNMDQAIKKAINIVENEEI